MNLAKETAITLVQLPLASGSTDVGASAILDMAGYGAATFVLVIGAQDAGATVELKIQESIGEEAPTDIPGAVAVSPVNSDNKLLVVEVRGRQKPYLAPFVTRGGTGNTTTGGVIAIQHEARLTPAEANPTHAAAPVSVT